MRQRNGGTRVALALGIVAGACLPAAAQAESLSRVAVLASACNACHGIDGRGANKIPKLRGLKVRDFVATMKGFQNGTEKSTIMDRIAKAYAEEDIQLLAEHFASLKPEGKP
jgi:cytochrome c553